MEGKEEERGGVQRRGENVLHVGTAQSYQSLDYCWQTFVTVSASASASAGFC